MLCTRNLQRPSDLFAAALGATSDIVVVVDEDGVMGYVSPAAERVLGHHPTHWRHRRLDEVVHGEDRDLILDLLTEASISLPARRTEAVRVRVDRADGACAELEASRLQPISLIDQTGVIVVLRDVTELLEAERGLDRAQAEVDFLVFHDSVTGLPNRAHLEQHLDDLCAHDADAAQQTQLLMAKVIDADGLRDRHGARVADSIICSLGRTVRALVEPGDFIAVVGTGEFVVVNAPGTSTLELDGLADSLLAIADIPMPERNRRIDLRFAIGQAPLLPEHGAATSLDLLLHAARGAIMTGTRSPVVAEPRRHGPDDPRRPPADIEHALANDEFELHYQPVRDVYSGRVASFEALLRWNHPDDGVIVAGDFLPAVEGTALIVDIGDFVLAEGCAQLARWQRRYGARAPSLALNVSARQLRQGDFAQRVRGEIANSGADPSGLCLELTETHALESEPRALAELERVRQLGASIALDDFGTGYSSLRQLQKIAADVLKIDRSFVKNVGIDGGATAIVRAAIDLGAAFGMTTVAEGVTTIEQHRLLLAMGCDRIQGYLIAPALPAELAEAMLCREPSGDPLIGAIDPDKDVHVLHARGRLATIDVEYEPSEEEVAALAGVTSVDARRRLTRPDGPPR